MHTIDLLKGQGLPAKTTLGSVFFTAMIFVVPLLVGAAMLGFYLVNKIEIDVQQRQLTSLKNDIARLEPNVMRLNKLKNERDSYTKKLTEVSKCVETNLQLTPVLISVAENIPEKMLMNKLSVTNEENRGTRKISEPNKPLIIPIPQRKMTAELTGSGRDGFNKLVQDYQQKLKSEPSLKSKLKTLTYLMQTASADNPRESYTMSFVFEKQKK